MKNISGRSILTGFLLVFSFVISLSAFSQSKVLWIAHRGESADAPQNTLSAFKLAMERDADGMETDIRLTSDLVLVCAHDANTKRTCGVSKVVEKTPFSELRKLDASDRKIKYKGEVIPTFAEALSVLRPGKQFYVEIKENDERVIDAMMREVDRSKVSRDQIVMISFHREMVRKFKEKYPKQKALWLTGVRIDRQGKRVPSEEDLLKTLADLHADGVNAYCCREYYTPDFVKRVKAKGYYFAVWTVDDAASARYFAKEIGIDSVTSNRAAKLKNLIGNTTVR